MSAGRKRLGEAELEVMLAVWACPAPVTASRVQEEMERSWKLPTLMTVLGRLCQKGYLRCEKEGRSNFYRPLVTREEYREGEGRTLLRRLYGNSLPRLVASLHESGAVGEEELEALRRFLDEEGGKEG